MSTTWDSLPVELTLHICEHLVEDTCDLVSLMLTCHVLHHSAHSTLYRHNVKHQRSSALFWAARHGHIRTIQAVLDHGADVNMASNCRSLQGIASYFHRRYTYTFPEQQDLDLGSDMKDSQDLVDAEYAWFMGDTTDSDLDSVWDPTRPYAATYWTPLHAAARYGQVEAISFLLDQGADMQAMSYGLCIECTVPGPQHPVDGIMPRYYPLYWAIHGAHVAAAQLLLDRGAPLQTAYRKVPVAAEHAWFDAAKAGLAPILRRIHDEYPDRDWANVVHHSGRKALHYAVWHCREEARVKDTVRYLIDIGASIHEPCVFSCDVGSDWMHCPLTRACDAANLAAARCLLEAGANPNIRDAPVPGSAVTADQEKNPLIIAVVRDHLELAQLLLSYGADPHDRGHGKCDALGFTLARIGELQSRRGALCHVPAIFCLMLPRVREWAPIFKLVFMDTPENCIIHMELCEFLLNTARTEMFSREEWETLLLRTLEMPLTDMLHMWRLRRVLELGRRLSYAPARDTLLTLVSKGVLHDDVNLFRKLFHIESVVRSEGGYITKDGVLRVARQSGARRVVDFLAHDVVPPGSAVSTASEEKTERGPAYFLRDGASLEAAETPGAVAQIGETDVPDVHRHGEPSPGGME